jgi:DNA-binding MarR family transcriptional regulator
MKREQKMYKWNQRPEFAAPTFTMEDYLQTIYLLSGERGYAHVRDIADSINVLPSRVTRMIKKIKALVKKNEMLVGFLRTIGVPEKKLIWKLRGLNII